jgi:hypothetical protein
MFIKNKNNSEKNKKNFFIKIKKLKLDDNYDYNESNYINNRTKIKIKCKKHNIFFYQIPTDHLKGYKSCLFCSQNKKMDNIIFVEKANILHNNKYDYSLVEYINSKTKIKIICPEHGIFEQMPYLHLQEHGCPICRISYFEKFIEKANILHNNKYDYSLVKYINNNTKIKIICPEHGEFKQTPNHHLKGFGCNKCSCSKGENIIFNMLTNLNIKFEYQKKFNNCKNKRILPFDFYLPDYNICIEYDGRHHYEPIKYWGGDDKLEYTKNNDEIKNNYCKNNNIILIRLKYDMKILEILDIIKTIK